MAKPTDNQRCKAERRHIPAHVFVTYDAMRASIDEKHVYYGGAYKLANLNNRNVESERTALKWLEAEGWIVLQNGDGRRRFHGRMDTDRWLVLWHDEWLAAQPGRACPPDKYVPAGERDWKLAVPGQAAPGLWLRNLKAAAAKAGVNLDALPTGAEPEDVTLALALLAVYRQEMANTGDPVQATNTDRPVLAESTNTGEPVLANTGSPVLPNTDRPVLPNTGAPVGSFTSSRTESTTPSPTLQPENRTEGGQEAFHDFAPSGAGDHEAEIAQAMEAEERKQWQRFMNNLPEEMQGAILRKDYKPQLQAQIDASDVSVVLAALRLWIAERELPIADRKADKWGCWLAEGAPFLKRAVDNWRKRNRETRLWEFKTKIAPSIPQAFFDSDLSFGKTDRNNCEKVIAPTFAFPDFEQHQESFAKWEVTTADIKQRHELWADTDTSEELEEMRGEMRARIAQRRAEAQAAKA